MISKACVVGMYQRKLEEIARLSDVELCVAVPPYWREGNKSLALERAYTQGYTLQELPMALNGNYHLHFYPELGDLVRCWRPDMMHIDEEPYNLATFQAMRLAVKRGIPALFFTWQNLSRRYPYPFRLMEHYNLAHAACALAGNHEAAQVLRAKGYARDIYLIPQFGVDPDLYRRLSSEKHSGLPFVIGYMGRMVEEKGVQVLLQALVDLPGNWVVRLIGDGPYLSELQALSARLGLTERVSYIARVPSAQTPCCLNELDVLVLPSLTRENWKEQFGRILIEAMACEVPVLGSSSGEIPHLIDGAGLVFHEGDSAQLGAELQRLMTDGELRADLGQRGRARVLEHYTQQRIARDTYAVYEQVLSRAWPGRS